jgi:SAM-dependent methyltransferase
MSKSLKNKKGGDYMNGHVIKIVDVLDFVERPKKEAANPKEVIRTSVFEKIRFPYLYLFPAMWIVIAYVLAKKAFYKLFFGSKPKINSIFFDGLGPWSKKVKDGAASWKALDIIYNHPFKRTYTLGNLVDEFWWFSQNCQAVRNRFKLVKQEVKKAILHFGKDNEEVRLVSLACGSAQAIIETVSELKIQGINVRVLLIDIEQEALDYAKGLAIKNNIAGQFDFVKANAYQTAKILRRFKPHIVEMLGLLDYLPRENAIRLISTIRRSLVPGGIFLTCNIRQNSEQHFVRWVIDWDMVYRSPASLAEVIEKSGFDAYRIVYEPLKIHGVVVAEKSEAKSYVRA